MEQILAVGALVLLAVVAFGIVRKVVQTFLSLVIVAALVIAAILYLPGLAESLGISFSWPW